ncbi:MAG: hypothetical protein M1136_00430 [Chloroflexi bacterium]|nr:hypothetical protein [Chloroflexota bacterium]MCL5074106.1 hypothetical protein [Chloroflexota bacterium]
MINIDVLHLIDRLEGLVTSGVRFPLTSKAVVDEQEFLDIIDQLRVAVPEEIRQAKRLNQEKDRLLGNAQVESEDLLNSAREQAARMLQENELVKAAQERADTLLREVQQQAEKILSGADNYAMEIFTGLENELNRLLAQVRKSRAYLEKASKSGQTTPTEQPVTRAVPLTQPIAKPEFSRSKEVIAQKHSEQRTSVEDPDSDGN